MLRVNAVLGAMRMPSSTLNVVCGVRLQFPGVPGGQIADDKPLPYSPSAENQSPRRSGNSTPLEILPADYEAFERLLGDIQAAWSNEDVAKLHTMATPEMVSYFTNDLQENRGRNVVNKVSDTKLLQGDLSEAWREGDTDYASVAMRFSMIDKTVDRVSGRLVEGSEQPTEATEVWTFVRPRGANWELSAIQQA